MELSGPQGFNGELRPTWAEAYIALGSNVGDREKQLYDALSLLDQHPDIEVTRVSGIYETDPVGYTDQPAFLNMAAALRTTLEPLQLLYAMLEMEKLLGRKRDIRWGPRTIDLDMLLYEKVALETEELILPHPRMMERAFVLVPLRDVLQEGHELETAVRLELHVLLEREEGIARWNTINWQGASAHSGS